MRTRIVSRAPVRVDPAGGGTDAPPYAIEYGGCVVNFSVARYSYAHLQRLDPGAGVHLCSLDLREHVHAPEAAALAFDGRLDLIKAVVRRLMGDATDFLLVTHSDVPVRTGLGGSGAMSVAVVQACLRAAGQTLDRASVALLANDIERGDLGHAGGSQDAFGAAFGGAKQIVYHQGGGCECRPLPVPPECLRQLERDLVLVYTGGIHLSGTIHDDIKRWYAMPDSPTIAAMDGLRAAALRMADALTAGRMDEVIGALNASRHHHYALHESCDSDTLRRFFTALNPYILGGKACGAGGGGFIVIYARPGCKGTCAEIAESLGGIVWPFTMDTEGAVAWQEPAWSAQELSRFLRSEGA